MNPETPPSPREELEIRLTAMLMGELSPAETAALQTQMAADPELAALHARLRQAMELLREASAIPEQPAPPVPAQLSTEKRERLLAHFKAPAPSYSPVIVKPRRNWKPYVPLGLAAALVAFLGLSLSVPMFSNRLGAPQVMVDSAEDFVIGQIRPGEGEQAEFRWDSQPGAVRALQRGYSAGGAGGADTSATQWMFTRPAEPQNPIIGRTAFWSEDEASKLKVNTASEGTFWDASARDSTLAREAKSDPKSPAANPPTERQLATNTAGFESARGGEAEVMRRSVRFATPSEQPPSAARPTPAPAAGKAGGVNGRDARFDLYAANKMTVADPAPDAPAPAPVALGSVLADAPASATSSFALVPDASAVTSLESENRFRREGKGADLPQGIPRGMSGSMGGTARASAGVPAELPKDISGVAPSTALAGEYDRGLSKHMDGAFGDKVDTGNVAFAYGTTPKPEAPMEPLAESDAIALPKLALNAPALAPADGKKAYFFEADMDGYVDLNEPKVAPASGPAPANPPLPEMLAKADFTVNGSAGTSSVADGNVNLFGARRLTRFDDGTGAKEGRESKPSDPNVTTAGRDVFFKESAGTSTLDGTAPMPTNSTASTAVNGSGQLGLNRAGFSPLEKGKVANENFLAFAVEPDGGVTLGDLEKKPVLVENEVRLMKERTTDYGITSGDLGGIAAGTKSRSQDWSEQTKPNALAWFGQAVTSGKDAPVTRAELAATTRGRVVEDDVKLALGEKIVEGFDVGGVESKATGILSLGASQPARGEYQRYPRGNGTSDDGAVRAGSKAPSPKKPAIASKSGAKQESDAAKRIDQLTLLAESEVKQQVKELSDSERVVGKPVEVAKREEAAAKPLYESVDEFVMQAEPELKAEVEQLLAKHAGAGNQARNVNRSEDDELMEYQKGVEAVKGLQAEIDSPALGKDVRELKARTRDEKIAALDVKQREIATARLARELKLTKEAEVDGKKLRDLMERNKALVASKNQKDDKPAAAKPAEPAPIPQAEVATSANAFSTFSLNVSDVAFKLAAASLEKGQMPELATVRSEEFINAFDYRDPEPAGGAPLAFAAERARYPFAQNRDLLRLSVKTAAAGRQPGRALNLVLLLDNSGSMERADRVRILHESLRVLATQLQPQDKLSVVTFARTPRLWADGVAGDKAGEVTARVGEITPQGGTNLSAALDLGYATARKHFQPGSINRVVLLTDGAANLGDVNPDALKQKVETNRQQGIALDCFGIGWEGYDDTLLEALSRNGDGRYGFINSPEEAATEFAGQLAGALRVAASDVKVQVEFNPRRVTAYRQIGYAKHQLKKEQFRDNTVDAAEIGAAESGNALYAVEVNPRGTGDLATVRVRFKVPGTADYREHEWTVPFTREAAPLEQASPALRLAGTASAFSEWLVSSQYATEVTPDRLLGLLNGVPATFGADPRPQKLEWMIRQAKSVSGR